MAIMDLVWLVTNIFLASSIDDVRVVLVARRLGLVLPNLAKG